MNRKKFVALSLLTSMAACTVPNSDKKINYNNKLFISVPSSMYSAMKLVKDIYQNKNSDIEILYNSGSSGALQQQIERGAPVDVFISASSKQIDFLLKKDLLIKESSKIFLKNTMVLVASSKSIEKINLNTLINGDFKKLALGELRSVPAGQYAKEALISLKVYEKLEPKFIFGKNVRQVLFYVESGNADLGIVYITDLKNANDVRLTNIPYNLHSPITYQIAIVKSSQNIDEARKFINFLLVEKTQNIFQNYGFIGINNQKNLI
ncbi:molybdate ABC transporter substrate-binding protein [Candidatus Atelocyanobacterium thalassae]|uniref:Molybdate-binding protein ModA n=1 Tax=cyanobacterium endosymbiont of Braarudosphaera bigelowii TaxID=1285375 RepID=A0ABM7U4B4_9CHRO|nr:molybdate ABC transporter substrate-binding protein [Candidatus Atelocyanobacterium thalassa]BDA39535.1 molybdate-binding protein ModA [cyanobacterium endosymbiont of Braarudosphaera bigelowii]